VNAGSVHHSAVAESRTWHPTGEISLAVVAARFANNEGCIVVFGMATKRAGSGETITKIHPIRI
jgi:hypothetical protein